MEKEAIVTGLEGRHAVIELTRRSGGCGRCHEAGGCQGSNVIGRMFGRSCHVFRIPNTIEARQGEAVVVRLNEGAVLHVALMVYLLPVVLLVVGAFAGVALAATPGDAAALIGAGVGLSLGIAAVVIFLARERRQGRLQPVLVRGPVSGS